MWRDCRSLSAASLTHTLFLLSFIATVTLSRPHVADNSLRDMEEYEDVRLPLSVRDGFFKYSHGNSSFDPLYSRNTFLQLKTDEDVQREKQAKEEAREKKREERRKKKKGKKGSKKMLTVEDEVVPRGWKNALSIALANPNALRDDNSSCKTLIFKQKIHQEGCLSRIVVNRLCHGSCPSLFIPRIRAKKLKAQFESMSRCTATEYDTMKITLECPQMDPPTVNKTVTIVKNCSCVNVDLSSL